ncbi:hypothetical protein L1887_18514 [Cichorium endivia]|nr:hypothetical protein L1887_18514 [Cichorium endivia]
MKFRCIMNLEYSAPFTETVPTIKRKWALELYPPKGSLTNLVPHAGCNKKQKGLQLCNRCFCGPHILA